MALSTHTVVVDGNGLMGFIGFLETYKEKASSVLLFTLASLPHLYLPQAERLFGRGENRAHYYIIRVIDFLIFAKQHAAIAYVINCIVSKGKNYVACSVMFKDV